MKKIICSPSTTTYGARSIKTGALIIALSFYFQAPALAQSENSQNLPPLAPSIQTTEKNEDSKKDIAAATQSNVAAATSSGTRPSVKDQLSAFEERFFANTFADESDSKRMDRIERVVYGRRRSGDTQQRLSRLMMDVPVIAEPANSQRSQIAAAPTNNEVDQDPASPEQAYNDYPTVTALEEQILGRTYEQLPVQQRLAQLEVKAFGQASSSNDLAGRVDRLRQYVASKNNLNENYLQDNGPNFSQGLQTGSIESQITEMEQEVYGKTYGRDTLISRLNRLDNTVFAGQPPQTFTPITMRVNKLWSVLQPKFTAPQTAYKYAPPQQTNDDDKKKEGHPIWRKIGHFVEGVGMVAGEAAGAAAMGTAMGYGYGYGGYGWGYPGFYPGYFGSYGYGPRFMMW